MSVDTLVQEIDINLLQPHPRNVEIYGEEDISELVEYIRESKWIKPLVISQHNQIISGHRRWQAARILGYMSVPFVKQVFETETDELKALLLENASRDKNPAQKVHEADAWKDIEEDEARQRSLSNLAQYRNNETDINYSSERENFPVREDGRTRDKLAERVGFGSGKTYESAARVVKSADQLKKEGKIEEGQALLKVLNEQSVNAATRVLSMPEPQKEAVLQVIASGKASTVKQAEAVIEQVLSLDELEEEDDDDSMIIIGESRNISDFQRWQEDNISLGLDRFGDVPQVKEPAIKSVTLTALQSSESTEWYTPKQYVDAARVLMGGIDIDPASNEFANKVIRANVYYDAESNGLTKPWHGRVWLNPPYGFTDGKSNQEVWTNRLISQFNAGVTKEVVLLVNANTEAKWFQPLYDYLICFTNHRIRFYNTDGDSSQPTQGNALVYLGNHKRQFIELFSRFGRVIREAKTDEY